MKTIAYIFLLIAGGIFGTQNLEAQNKRMTAEQRIEKRVEKMKVALNLSDDQVIKIKSIYKDAWQKQAELKKSGTDSATLANSRKEINKSVRNQIKLVLTEEQRKKWKDNLKARKEKMNSGGDE
jgi:hypothetical protein